VTRPISDLVHAARAIGGRDLHYRVKSEGSQEQQDLAQSFNRMAEELERAETVRRNLMADVAHELRTPLTILDGNLRAMLDGVRPLDEAGIAALMEETHHLNRLVEDLRLLSQAEAEKLTLFRTPVDLEDLVQETIAHFSPLAGEQGVVLNVGLDRDLQHPALDSDRILQVLHNLVANALAHTPRGGRITVTARRADHPRGIRVAVEDDGEGIAPEALAHMFERFYLAGSLPASDRRGAGLGLAIVKALVEAHGGAVSAESGGTWQGSTFTVELPISTTPMTQRDGAAIASGDHAGQEWH
jgi:signal transduction histidine kinase